jgi:hypothetical protein
MAATVAGWIAYAADRGTTVADDADSAAALVRATDYVTRYYVPMFGAGYDIDSPNVEPAIYEAANLELATPGFFSKTYTPDQQKVLTEVKGIKWTVTGGDVTGLDAATPKSTMIEALLRPYMITVSAVYTV